jgi:hypothetical protein
MKYYEVLVAWQDVDDTKVKKFKERYLVFAVSVTDAEARVTKTFSDETPTVDFEVKSAKESNIVRVIEAS